MIIFYGLENEKKIDFIIKNLLLSDAAGDKGNLSDVQV
jgi:hypothetical protein